MMMTSTVARLNAVMTSVSPAPGASVLCRQRGVQPAALPTRVTFRQVVPNRALSHPLYRSARRPPSVPSLLWLISDRLPWAISNHTFPTHNSSPSK
eukprot:956739-Pyramimonas_sp.AAC.1